MPFNSVHSVPHILGRIRRAARGGFFVSSGFDAGPTLSLLGTRYVVYLSTKQGNYRASSCLADQQRSSGVQLQQLSGAVIGR